jgi:hypothetical protein
MSSRIVVLVLAAASVVPVAVAEQPPKLDYAIEDQFGDLHTDEDCGRTVTILLGGGRKGITYIDQWGPRLHEELSSELASGEVCSVGFAHLKGVPFFVKKKVVSSFPRDPEAWTMLDWKGEIARTWGAEKDAANLYVFDDDGELVLHEGLLDYDPERMTGIVRTIRSLLGEP